MGLQSFISGLFGGSGEKSMEGRVATRELCVGDVTEDTVWFEVCDPDASDFRFQYGVPRRHYEYSRGELDVLEGIDDEDRMVYEVTLECGNERGTLWLFRSMDEVRELPPGYRKDMLSL